MKLRLLCLAIALLTSASFAPLSHAGANANAKIMVHLAGQLSKKVCDVMDSGNLYNCSAAVTAGETIPAEYYAYVLVVDGDRPAGIGGVQFGIEYDGPGTLDGAGVEVFSWTVCPLFPFDYDSPTPTWPNSGSGMRITWNTDQNGSEFGYCQRLEPSPGAGVQFAAGVFHISAYTPARFAITPHPSDGLATVWDCCCLNAGDVDIVEGGSVSHAPPHLGFADLGGGSGYNPCNTAVPVETRTWGAIKSILR